MKKVLAVVTSDHTELNGKRTGLWLSELTHFLEVVEKAGLGYDIASPKGGKVPLDEKSSAESQLRDPVNARFLAKPEFAAQLERSRRCAEVDPSGYVAIYLAGGHGTMFDFRQSQDVQRLLTAFWSQGQFVTGVCHGVAGLVGATDAKGELLVKGRLVTGFSNFEDQLAGTKNLMPFLLEDALKTDGAKYRKNLIPFTSRVEVDGKLITGQNPQSAKGVGLALVEALSASR